MNQIRQKLFKTLSPNHRHQNHFNGAFYAIRQMCEFLISVLILIFYTNQWSTSHQNVPLASYVVSTTNGENSLIFPFPLLLQRKYLKSIIKCGFLSFFSRICLFFDSLLAKRGKKNCPTYSVFRVLSVSVVGHYRGLCNDFLFCCAVLLMWPTP